MKCKPKLSNTLSTNLHSYFIILLIFICLFLFSHSSWANIRDGIYQVNTSDNYKPVIVIQNGKVSSTYGQLKNDGCLTRQAGSTSHTSSLDSLNRATANPFELGLKLVNNRSFTTGSIELGLKEKAPTLTHTVNTHLVNEKSKSLTICKRYHNFSIERMP